MILSRFQGVRTFLLGPALTLTAFLASTLVDSGADHYLRAREITLNREITQERLRVSLSRRPVTFGEPLEQNAAVWYRRAFARIVGSRVEELQRLQQSVDAGYERYSNIGQGFDATCHEATGLRAENALRCTRCNWELGYNLSNSSLFESVVQAATLANCLTLEGHRSASVGDWRMAAQLYLKAISFGCDLGLGNLIMNVLGIGAAQAGVRALGNVVVSAEFEDVVLEETADRLQRLQSILPTVRNGLYLDQLQLASALLEEARASALSRKAGLGRVLPWYTIEAWQFSHDLRLLNELVRADTINDPQKRARFIQGLKDRSTASSSAVMREAVTDTWLGAVDKATDLMRDSRMVMAAIKAERWHSLNGQYPDNLAELGLSRAGDFQYERAGDGYRLFAVRRAGAQEVQFVRRSGSEASTP
jgi:hypothetical protein